MTTDPTPEEFTDQFLASDRDTQIEVARRVLEAMNVMSRCFLMNHEGLADENRFLSRRLVELQNLRNSRSLIK